MPVKLYKIKSLIKTMIMFEEYHAILYRWSNSGGETNVQVILPVLNVRIRAIIV